MSDEPKTITLDIPQREGKEGYIGTMLTLFLQLGRTFTDTNFKETNIAIVYHMNFMISMIPTFALVILALVGMIRVMLA